MSASTAAALDALFQAPGSDDATYIPVSGSPHVIRTIRRQRWMDVGTVRPHAVAVGSVFDIRRSEVQEPAVGDALLVAGKLFGIVVPPELDVEGLTWMCDAPALERTISIMRAERALNAYGDPEDGFTSIVTVPAARLDRTGTELAQGADAGNQVVARRGSVFYVAWTADTAAVTPRDRIAEGDLIYDVEDVAEIGLRGGVEIAATARVG